MPPQGYDAQAGGASVRLGPRLARPQRGSGALACRGARPPHGVTAGTGREGTERRVAGASSTCHVLSVASQCTHRRNTKA